MIELRGVSLRRGREPLFGGVDLMLPAGAKVGVVGRNGSGKSSFFSLLLGELGADAGEVRLPSGIRIAHVSQETAALARSALDHTIDGDVELRALEAKLARAEREGDGERLASLHAELEAHGGYTAAARAAELLAGLGFRAEEQGKPVAEFSGGWRMRLNLAQTLMFPAELLLLDEPTNHLDLDALLWLERWLQGHRGTLLLITHDREFLDNVVGHILHVHRQSMTLYRGDYSTFERAYAERLARDRAMREEQERERRRIRAFVDRFRAKASKARQVQSRLKALGRMEEIAAAHVDAGFHFEFPAPPRIPSPLVSVEEASVGYGAQPVLRNISFSLLPGSRIGLVGPNGAGKSTLLKLLAERLEPSAGVRFIHPSARVGYFAQHQIDELDLSASPLEHLARLAPEAPQQALLDYLGGFGFRGERVGAEVATFSGGERARLAFALLVWLGPSLLLLDEPTNHLDVDMRHAMTSALQSYEGALVMVSHDRHLLRSVTDELWLLRGGEARPFDGDLDAYRKLLAASPAKPEGREVVPRKDRRSERREAARRRERRQPQAARVRELEQAVARLAREKREVDGKLAEPALYSEAQAGELEALFTRRARLAESLARAEHEWLEAQHRLEAMEDEGEP